LHRIPRRLPLRGRTRCIEFRAVFRFADGRGKPRRVLFPPIDDEAETVRDALKPLRNRIRVALFSFGNPFAIGAAIRVSHSFLVDEILIVGDAPFYEKASMGMEKYETIVRLADESDLLRHCAGRPLWAVEKVAAATNLYGVPEIPDDVVFVFGSERFGIPANFLAQCTQTVALPMFGVNNSFPVAITVGMVLGEWGRRRYRPGTTL
jgi:tRNA G18 (ribose-2'-O)-methylase SpoU